MTVTTCRNCRQSVNEMPNGTVRARDESILCLGRSVGDRVQGHVAIPRP